MSGETGLTWKGAPLFALFGHTDAAGAIVDVYREEGWAGALFIVNDEAVHIPAMVLADLRDALTAEIAAQAQASRTSGGA